jgi:peptidoglycan/LPS O-acetylase OafA/YrhL
VTEQRRLEALDLLRGLAALSVLILHLPWATGDQPLPKAYLAVDLFFLLSGFVIAHAYSYRLGTPALFKQYCVARFVRLYPLYVLATLIAAGELAAYLLFGRGANPNVTILRSLGSLATAIFLLPTPIGWSVEPGMFFPLVASAWSLFWEVVVNFLYGVAGGRMRPGILALLMLIGAAGVIISYPLYGTDGIHGDRGPGWVGAWSGGARALFSFFAGVALFRLRQSHRAPAIPASLLGTLLVLTFVPASLGGWPGWGGWAYDLVCIFLLFPLLIWFGAEASISPKVRSFGLFIGFLSYPLYLLHPALFRWLQPVWPLVEQIIPVTGSMVPLGDCAVILLVTWLVARSFDLPVREWLNNRFVPGAPQPPAESAP